MNQPSNISEASRRAIALCRERHQMGGLVRDSEMEAVIATALDTAHPAPKEGLTPETEAFSDARMQKMDEWRKDFGAALDFARSLELRLAEKTRRLQQAEELLGEGLATLEAWKNAEVGDDPEANIERSESFMQSTSSFLNSKTL